MLNEMGLDVMAEYPIVYVYSDEGVHIDRVIGFDGLKIEKRSNIALEYGMGKMQLLNRMKEMKEAGEVIPAPDTKFSEEQLADMESLGKFVLFDFDLERAGLELHDIYPEE